LFLTAFFGFFAAKFPNYAPLAKLAIGARVGTGLAAIQAFLTIIIIHFLAMDACFPVGVKSAIHEKILKKIGIVEIFVGAFLTPIETGSSSVLQTICARALSR
jgi:hypothetical protein